MGFISPGHNYSAEVRYSVLPPTGLTQDLFSTPAWTFTLHPLHPWHLICHLKDNPDTGLNFSFNKGVYGPN